MCSARRSCSFARRCGRLLDQRITQRAAKFWKLLRRPVQHIARKQSSSRTKLDQINTRRRIQRPPHLFELPRQQPPKHGVNIAGGVEISRFAELLARARVVAELRLVEAKLHVARERNRPGAADLFRNALAQTDEFGSPALAPSQLALALPLLVLPYDVAACGRTSRSCNPAGRRRSGAAASTRIADRPDRADAVRRSRCELAARRSADVW